MRDKFVYFFGEGKAEGTAQMKDLLGGKGAGLAEMTNLGISVPPGFTITTEACNYYYANQETVPPSLAEEQSKALERLEKILSKKFGSPESPLLVSVRSGARASMPGMMDTILNLGLNDRTVEGLAKLSGDARFAYDSYRRFIQMYANVVLGMEHGRFEGILEHHKSLGGLDLDTDLDAKDWLKVIGQYKAAVEEELGNPCPQDPSDQLWNAIGAVFGSWQNPQAITYRRLHDIPDDWGTAVT